MALLDELLVGLGFDYDEKEAAKFNEDIGKSVDLVKKLTRAAIVGATAITGLTVASTRASDEQGKLANEIGDTVENIDALQFAQKIAGGSADELASNLRDLSIRAAEAARGTGSAIEAFGILGISVTDANGEIKSTTDLLLEVANRFEGLKKEQQIELADKLGLRGSIRLLQQGRAGIQDLIAEAQSLGVTTQEDANISAEFQDELVRLWTISKDVSRTLTREFAPILSDLVSTFVDWWKANKELIKQKLPEWIDMAAKAVKFLALAVGALLAYRIVTGVVALVGAMKKFTLATLAANAAAAALPLLIIGLIAAIGLLAEDAKKFMDGHDSFLGEMINKYPEWADNIRTVAAVMTTIADLTMMIFEGWKGIIDIFKDATLDDLKRALNPFAKGGSIGFLRDLVGLEPMFNVGDSITAPVPIPQGSRIKIDNMQLQVEGGASPEATGKATVNAFLQATQDLQTPVEQ